MTGQPPPSSQPTVGLSMIVKNGGEDLRLCLESVAGLVSQIVIADTGSADDSCAVARTFGATVLSVPWADHFANARNAALAAMTTDWVLVLDADETLEEGSMQAIRTVLDSVQNTPALGGFLVPVLNYFREPNVYLNGHLGGSSNTPDSPITGSHLKDIRTQAARSSAEHQLCRLFRRHSGVRYAGRVHEMVEPSIQALGLDLAEAPFRILHFGQLASPEQRQQKNHFYRHLGQLKVAEEPTNFLAWYELGSLEQVRFHNSDEALRCLRRAVELAPANHPCLPPAWTRIFQIHAEKNETNLALEAASRLGPAADQDLTVVLQKADLFAAAERLNEAQTHYLKALGLCAPSSAPYWPIQNRLGLVEVRLGCHSQGLARLDKSTAACPQFLEHHEHRMQGHLLAGNLVEATEAACHTLRYFLSVRLYLRAALLLARTGDQARRRHILEEGLTRFPASVELAEALTQLPMFSVATPR